MANEKEEEKGTSFEEELPKLLEWFADKKDLLPHLEAILAWGLSQDYRHESTIPSLKLALDKFIGIENSGTTLLICLGYPEVFERQEVKDKGLDISDFMKWLDGLKERFQESVRRGIFRHKYPNQFHFVRFRKDEEGLGLLVVRGDGDKIEFVVPYEQGSGFILEVIQAFSAGGGATNFGPEELQKIRKGIDDLTKKVINNE